jgi:integrase
MKVRRETTKAGTVRWFMDWRDSSGARHRETIVAPDGLPLDKRRASVIAAGRWAQIADRERPADGADRLTLRALLDLYIARPGIADQTRRLNRETAERLVSALPAQVSDLSQRALDAYISARATRTTKAGKQLPRSNRTINIELSLLRAALKWARERSYIAALPVAVRLLPERHGLDHVLIASDVEAILSHARDAGLYDEIAILANLALRPGELWRMRWSQIDLRAGTIAVTSRKRGAGSAVITSGLPLNPAAQQILAARAARNGAPPDGLVFGVEPWERGRSGKTRSGERGHAGGVVRYDQWKFSARLKRLARLAGIGWWQRVRPYDLRHFAATAMLGSGVAAPDVARVLRNNTATMLKYYAHSIPAQVSHAVNSISVGSPMGSQPAPTKAKARRFKVRRRAG